ncbi:winged helix-turn-helix domain-containing protein [Candidatus Symbiopectobacterium sp. NZEC151]|uniref:winged helix-turn-helix domain-containing protein n=2 Tax=unclassified Symbiopectobacterium TaxID=2794573 RepID=UPI002226D44A|nr:winged helix-turn-helix domain-containing protein [Candidatus Symbiopectobacterium sp. NZEC151]MCW2475974.1 winged helix-turn-helix domain-containing protein [Candidatus Symbiopectobacterium sp. NZEC151]
MIYFINQLIIFDSDERTLSWQAREDEAVSLSIPVSRLFETLITNPGTLLSRELLMREALEKHALSPSINNLNNYVSLLRKVLREFDLDDAIVTVPKSGIIFNISDVNVIENNRKDKALPEGTETDESTGSPAMPQPALVQHKKKQGHLFRWGLSVLSIAVLFLAGFTMIAAKESYFPARSTLQMDGNGKCEMYYLYDRLTDEDDTLSASTVESLCSNNVLFFLSKKVVISDALDKRNEIIITCKQDGKECVTYVNY